MSERNVTRTGLAVNAGARLSGGSTLENCKRRREQNRKHRKLPGLWENESDI